MLSGILFACLMAAPTVAGCGGGDQVSGPAVVYVRQGRQWPQPIDTVSLHFVRVLRSDGTTVFTQRLSRPTRDEPVSHVALELDAGEYRLVFFERGCAGLFPPSKEEPDPCKSLEPPSYRCEYPLEVGEGETVALVARVILPHNDCEIQTE